MAEGQYFLESSVLDPRIGVFLDSHSAIALQEVRRYIPVSWEFSSSSPCSPRVLIC